VIYKQSLRFLHFLHFLNFLHFFTLFILLHSFTEMDSEAISVFISTLVVNSIVMMAFATIDGFHKEFMEFVLHILGESADILSLQTRLQEIFLDIIAMKLQSTFRNAHHKWLKRCYLHGRDCKTIHECESRNPNHWWQALKVFKDEILSVYNMRSASLSWALENIPAFRTAFDKYMAEFARIRHLCKNSTTYIEHLARLKNDLQSMMDNFIELQRNITHYNDCQGGGDSDFCCETKSYELCIGYCIPQQEAQWKVLLDEWISTQQEYNAMMADRSEDFVESESDLKEMMRRDFTKNTKNILRDTKRRLRQKGNL